MRRHYLVIFVVFIIISCMKKQEHDIVSPDIPAYSVSGITTDIDVGEKLSQIQLIFQPDPLNMSFDCSPTEQVTFSDSTGAYKIELCPGNYTLIVLRNKLPVYEKKLTITKSNRILDIRLPTALVTAVCYNFKNIEGIFRKKLDTFTIAASILAGGQPTKIVHRIFEGNFQSSFKIIQNDVFAEENPQFNGLVYAKGKYFSAVGSISKPQLASIDPISGKVIEVHQVPHRLVDLAYDGQNIWGISPVGKLYQFKGITNQVLNEYPSPGKYPSGISWNGNQIYTCDTSLNSIFIHNHNLKIVKTYRPVFFTNENMAILISDFSFMASDSDHNLYLVKADTIFSFILNDRFE